jgi:hypothetical protein
MFNILSHKVKNNKKMIPKENRNIQRERLISYETVSNINHKQALAYSLLNTHSNVLFWVLNL